MEIKGNEMKDDILASVCFVVLILLVLALLMVAPANAIGRDKYTPDVLPRINRDIASLLELPVLPEPQVTITREHLGGMYGHAAVKGLVVYLNPTLRTVKNHHMAHELVHYYQHYYKLDTGICGKEYHAQVVTTQWCKRNNCPVWVFENCKKKEQVR